LNSLEKIQKQTTKLLVSHVFLMNRGLSRFAYNRESKDELGTFSKLLTPKTVGFLFCKHGCGGSFMLLQFTLLWV